MQTIDKSIMNKINYRRKAQKIKLFKPKGWGWLFFPFYLVLFLYYNLFLMSAQIIFVLPFIKFRKGFFIHFLLALIFALMLFSYEIYSFYYLLLGQVGRIYYYLPTLWGYFLPISFFIYVFLGLIFVIRIYKASKRRIPTYDDVLNEVLLVKGKNTHKHFIKETYKLAKKKNLEELQTILKNEYDDCLNNKHLVLDKKAYSKTAGQICIAVGLAEGNHAIKNIKKQLDDLYKKGQYQEIHDIFAQRQPQIEAYKQKLESLGLASDEFIKVFYGSKINYLFALIKAILFSVEKTPVFTQSSRQVYLAKGKKAQIIFINKAFNLSKNSKFDELGKLLSQEFDYYKSVEHLIWTKDEYEIKARVITLGYALFERTSTSKEVKKRITRLYKYRELKVLNELYDKFNPQVEEYKNNIIAKEGLGNATLEHDGKGTFDGLLLEKIGLNILCTIVNVFTLFIAYPVTICWKQKWLKSHTIYDGKRLSFDGNGMQLFGKWVLWLFLSVITFGIFYIFLPNRVEAWKSKHTHVNGEIKSLGGTFDGSIIGRLGIKVLCFAVNLFTLFICKPFTICWKQKWLAKHTVHDGKRLSFDGNGFQLIGKWILWIFLTVITFGIYGLFVSLRMEKWKAKHTHLSKDYEYVL